VTCWGGNDSGQLGDATITSRATPATVLDLENVRQLEVGTFHVCALLANKTVRCWGNNDAGQLGDGTTSTRTRPVQVKGLRDVEQLALGGGHSCARLTSGTVRCWGANGMAQLGVPGRSLRLPTSTPVAVGGISNAIDLAAGLNHTCVRTPARVSCWGWNEECQLGFKDHGERCMGTPCKATPTPVPSLTDVAELALSDTHSCARHTDGTVSCWGDDPAAYLPDNSVDAKVPRLCEPTRVTSLRGAAQVATYGGGVCALLPANTIVCWGSNWFGELGDGTNQAHRLPAPVTR
jgi:alpha-tubulin suppressor-like RCC1 family protein